MYECTCVCLYVCLCVMLQEVIGSALAINILSQGT